MHKPQMSYKIIAPRESFVATRFGTVMIHRHAVFGFHMPLQVGKEAERFDCAFRGTTRVFSVMHGTEMLTAGVNIPQHWVVHRGVLTCQLSSLVKSLRSPAPGIISWTVAVSRALPGRPRVSGLRVLSTEDPMKCIDAVLWRGWSLRVWCQSRWRQTREYRIDRGCPSC